MSPDLVEPLAKAMCEERADKLENWPLYKRQVELFLAACDRASVKLVMWWPAMEPTRPTHEGEGR